MIKKIKHRNTILVMAVCGEPLRRVAISRNRRLIYVANPASLSRIKDGHTEPVGFPAEHVFAFDAALYASLRERWEKDGMLERGAWAEAEPWHGAIPEV